MEVGPDLIQSMLFVCAFVSMLFDYQLGMYSISEHRETFDARSDSTGDSQRSSGAFIFQRRRSRFRQGFAIGPLRKVQENNDEQIGFGR